MKIAVVLRHNILVKDGFAPHIDALRKRGHRVELFFDCHPFMTNNDWYDSMCDGLDKYRPDVIWTWNGRYPRYSNLFYELKNQGYRVLASERAWLPQCGYHFICDFEGPFHQCTYKIREDYPINEERIEKLKKTYVFKNKPLPFDYVLIPYQIETDTAITHLSPTIKTNDATIEETKKLFPGIRLLSSAHPLDYTRTYENDQTVYRGELTTLELAINANWVVAINSTVTIETLLWHGRVTILGKNVAWQAMGKPEDTQTRYKVLSYLLDRQYNCFEPSEKVMQYIEGNEDVY